MAERKYFDYDENELTPSQAAKKRYKQKHREKVLEDARVYAKKRYAENTEREKARHKKWREDNPEKYKESCKKSSAKKYKDNPEKVKELCEVFGLKLEKEFEAGQYHFGLIFRK